MLRAGTASLAALMLLGVYLRATRFRGMSVSHENGVCVLRDAAGELLLDPWKHPYVYLEPTRAHPRARVVSLGADGRFGGEGECADISSDQILEEPR